MAQAAAMNIAGLDLSITATGIARHDGSTYTVRPTTTGDRRLIAIRDAVGLTVGMSSGLCDLAVIEDLPTHAHSAGITGMVHGAVRSALLQWAVPYVLITPASVKKYACGKGNATKADMRMALYQRAGLDLRDDNQVDAWWLRAAAHDHYGEPVVQVPQSHRAALTKVNWPNLIGDQS
jgi:Holliday junction resolvasome RuvABC endonuclease subunit